MLLFLRQKRGFYILEVMLHKILWTNVPIESENTYWSSKSLVIHYSFLLLFERRNLSKTYFKKIIGKNM